MPKEKILNGDIPINGKRKTNHFHSFPSITAANHKNETVFLSGQILYFEINKKFKFVCNVCKTRTFQRLKEFFKHFKKCYAKENTHKTKILNESNSFVTAPRIIENTNIIENIIRQNASENITDETEQIYIVNFPQFPNDLLNGIHINSENIDERLSSNCQLDEGCDDVQEIGEIDSNYYVESNDSSGDIVFYNELSSENYNTSSQNLEKDYITDNEINIENENDPFSIIRQKKNSNESNVDGVNSLTDCDISIVNNNNCGNEIKSHLYLNFNNITETKLDNFELFEAIEEKWRVELNNDNNENLSIENSNETFNISTNNNLKDNLIANHSTLLSNIIEDNDFDSNDTLNSVEPNIIDNCEIIVHQEDSEFDDLPNFNIICEKCKGQFNSIEELQKHRKILNPSNPNIYECDLHFVTKKNSTLIDSTNKIDRISHQCVYCNKNYLKKDHLIEHERSMHLKDAPYECVYCNKKFVTSVARASHEKRHVLRKN